MDKEVVVHIYNEILFSYEKREILPFGIIWMDLEGIRPSERVEQIKTSTYDLIYTWNPEQTNLTGKVTRFVLMRVRAGAGGRGLPEKGDEKIQTPISKINKHQ